VLHWLQDRFAVLYRMMPPASKTVESTVTAPPAMTGLLFKLA
jgi:hypothetical protein